jgi:hypothetical protein
MVDSAAPIGRAMELPRSATSATARRRTAPAAVSAFTESSSRRASAFS